MLINRYVCIAFQLVCKHGGGWNGAVFVFVLVRVGTCWYEEIQAAKPLIRS
jgi:hypothetical protein